MSMLGVHSAAWRSPSAALTLLRQHAQRLGDVGVVAKGAPHLALQRACRGAGGGGGGVGCGVLSVCVCVGGGGGGGGRGGGGGDSG